MLRTFGFLTSVSYTPLYVDRILLWVYYNKIRIYPIVYLLRGDKKHSAKSHIVLSTPVEGWGLAL